MTPGRPCDSVLLDYTYFQDAQGRFVLGGRLQLEVEEWTKITVELSTDVRMSECRTEVLSTERTSANTCAMDYVSIKNRKGRLMVEEPFQIYLEGAKQVYQTGVTSVKLNQVEQCNYSHREGRGMVIVLDDPDISLVSRAREEKTEVTPGQEGEEEEDSGLLVILIWQVVSFLSNLILNGVGSVRPTQSSLQL